MGDSVYFDFEILHAIEELLRSGGRGAMATVTDTSGSAPQKPGARMLLTGNKTVGTVGGGAVEKRIIEELHKCAKGNNAYCLNINLMELGMCCGGGMSVFVEPVAAPPALFLFGAGHVGKATASIARSTGFAVTVIDSREELNTEERFPGCIRLIQSISEFRKSHASHDDKPSPTEQGRANAYVTEKSSSAKEDNIFAPWYLIFTHDHAEDESALETCLNLPHTYIGLIGSRRKIYKIIRSIKSRSHLPCMKKLYAPVGIDIGAQSPEELAVSIAAELIAVRNNQKAMHMRLMDNPEFISFINNETTSEEIL